MLCFVHVLHRCVWYVCCYVWKKLLSSVFAITERRDIGLYEMPLSLLGFGMGTMLANFHMCDLLFLLGFIASWT